jgi:hypothetical protein
MAYLFWVATSISFLGFVAADPSLYIYNKSVCISLARALRLMMFFQLWGYSVGTKYRAKHTR